MTPEIEQELKVEITCQKCGKKEKRKQMCKNCLECASQIKSPRRKRNFYH